MSNSLSLSTLSTQIEDLEHLRDILTGGEPKIVLYIAGVATGLSNDSKCRICEIVLNQVSQQLSMCVNSLKEKVAEL